MCDSLAPCLALYFLALSSNFPVLYAYLGTSSSPHLHQSAFAIASTGHNALRNLSGNATDSDGGNASLLTGNGSISLRTSQTRTATSTHTPIWTPNYTSFNGWHNSSRSEPSASTISDTSGSNISAESPSPSSLTSVSALVSTITKDSSTSRWSMARPQTVNTTVLVAEITTTCKILQSGCSSTATTPHSPPLEGSISITSGTFHQKTPTSGISPYVSPKHLNASTSAYRGSGTATVNSNPTSWSLSSVSTPVIASSTRIANTGVGGTQSVSRIQFSMSTLNLTKPTISVFTYKSVTTKDIGGDPLYSSRGMSNSKAALPTNWSSLALIPSAKRSLSLAKSSSSLPNSKINHVNSSHSTNTAGYSSSGSRSASSTPFRHNSTITTTQSPRNESSCPTCKSLSSQTTSTSTLSTNLRTASSTATSAQLLTISKSTLTSNTSMPLTTCGSTSKTQPATTSWKAGACTITWVDRYA